MSIDNPVGGNPQDPYERYRLIREQQEREQHEDQKPPDKKPHLAAQILALIKKTVESLLHHTKGREGKDLKLATPSENLFFLKNAFDTLKREDRNQDIPFLNEMSEIWHHILEDSLRVQRSDPFWIPFQNFLEDLQNYPPDEEHSFAYYLTEYTGQQWLPFPYMDLIHQIHLDYANNPKSSALERWTYKIDELRAILASSMH